MTQNGDGRNGASKGSGASGATIPLPAHRAIDPTFMQFVIQLGLNGGNASEAARVVGMSADWGRKMIAKNPELRDVARDAVGLSGKSIVSRWTDMHAEAIQKIRDLMTGAEDERVQLQAAQTVIERTEGKVPQKLEIDNTDPRDVLADLQVRFALALQAKMAITLAQALLVAEQNPEKVEEWGRKIGILPPAEMQA